MKIDENYRKMIKKRIESNTQTKKMKSLKGVDFEDLNKMDEMQLQDEGYKTPIVSASDNINKYIKNYGINFEIPSSHI